MAQLGARFHGMEEVIGSIPIRSTKQPLVCRKFGGGDYPLCSLGAEFRYFQRKHQSHNFRLLLALRRDRG